MFALFALGKSAEKTAYCIYADDDSLCEATVAKFNGDDTYTAAKLKIASVTAENTNSADAIIIFIQDMEIKGSELTILTTVPSREIYAWGCKVTVNIGTDEAHTEIPTSLSYKNGPIAYKGTKALSCGDIKKIGIPINLQAAMDYSVYDTYDCAIPSTFTVDSQNSGSIKYFLKSSSLSKTRLKIDGNKVIWGKTTITPGESELDLPTNTIISCTTNAPTAPIKVGAGCYFDASFKGIKTKYAEIKTSAFVLDDTITEYLNLNGISPTKYEVFCITKQADCALHGFEKLNKVEVSSTLASPNIAVFSKEVFTIPKANHALLSGFIIPDDATQIKIEIEGNSVPTGSLDLRQSIWTLSPPETSGSSLLNAEKITFSTEVNPNLFMGLKAAEYTVEASGLAITPGSNGKVDAAVFSVTGQSIPLTVYNDEVTMNVENDKVVVNGVTVAFSGKSIGLSTSADQKVILSQNNAAKENKISVTTQGNVAFDKSWNSVKDSFVDVKSPLIQAEFAGVPPWLSPSSVGSQGTIEQPAPPPTTPGGTGLESWAIAVIVIACVIVVAIIVVVALQFTGVISLCGKKKVEV